MKKKINDPFANLVLDEEERLLEEAFERGDYEEAPNFEETKLMLREAANNYEQLHKAKPVTIRINQLDLIKVKARAKKKNIPYQTLLGVLIHHYVDNDLELSI